MAALRHHAILPAHVTQRNINEIAWIEVTHEQHFEIRSVYKNNQRRSWYVTVADLNLLGIPFVG